VTDEFGRGDWREGERSARSDPEGRGSGTSDDWLRNERDAGDARDWDDADEQDESEGWGPSSPNDPWAAGGESRERDRSSDSGGGSAGDSGDLDESDESDADGSDRRGGRRTVARATEAATAWSAPPEPEDELRSFVESEALPSEERMAAAELEAEREAERDAAERRAHTDDAAAEGAAAAIRRRRGLNGRSVDGRLARIHLKGGLIALARAELETMAGQISLDLEALADLAEARWRSGDLLGAGEAAQAHLARGGDELMAMVVAVEALTAQGRTIDARRLAAQVIERSDGDLDPIFAGQPRAQLWSRPSEAIATMEEEEEVPIEAPAPTERLDRLEPVAPVWPDESRVTPLENIPPEERPAARIPGDSDLAEWPAEDRAERFGDEAEPERRPFERADFEPAAAEPEAEPPEAELTEPEPALSEADVLEQGELEPAAAAVGPSPTTPRGARAGRPAATPSARGELSAIESALRQGRLEPVTSRLALLLRIEPDLADRVAELSLAAIALTGGAAEAANLYIVRGDALRVLGRSDEADLAYEQSRRALEPQMADETGDFSAEQAADQAAEFEEPGLPALGLAEAAESPIGEPLQDEEALASTSEYAAESYGGEGSEYAAEPPDAGWAPGADQATPEGMTELGEATADANAGDTPEDGSSPGEGSAESTDGEGEDSEGESAAAAEEAPTESSADAPATTSDEPAEGEREDNA
jgi:hypothetical protein